MDKSYKETIGGLKPDTIPSPFDKDSWLEENPV